MASSLKFSRHVEVKELSNKKQRDFLLREGPFPFMGVELVTCNGVWEVEDMKEENDLVQS